MKLAVIRTGGRILIAPVRKIKDGVVHLKGNVLEDFTTGELFNIDVFDLDKDRCISIELEANTPWNRDLLEDEDLGEAIAFSVIDDKTKKSRKKG